MCSRRTRCEEQRLKTGKIGVGRCHLQFEVLIFAHTSNQHIDLALFREVDERTPMYQHDDSGQMHRRRCDQLPPLVERQQ